MTKLNKAVVRETAKLVGRQPVVVTLAPAREEVLLGFRLKGQRTQYVVRLSDVYRVAALWHGQKESQARREARKAGVPWRLARRRFLAGLRLV